MRPRMFLLAVVFPLFMETTTQQVFCVFCLEMIGCFFLTEIIICNRHHILQTITNQSISQRICDRDIEIEWPDCKEILKRKAHTDFIFSGPTIPGCIQYLLCKVKLQSGTNSLI